MALFSRGAIMAIKRFLQFTTKSSHDVSAEGGTAQADGSVIHRPLRFGQRAWATYRATYRITFAAITGSTPMKAVEENSAVATLKNSEGVHEGNHENNARHLEIGGYFHADHAWAGSMHETAPLENMFDYDAERVFDRFGPH
jgi:hypothetical protein